jgi:hypothetical protein
MYAAVEIEMQGLTGPRCAMELVISMGCDSFSAPDGTLRAVLFPHAHTSAPACSWQWQDTQRVSAHTSTFTLLSTTVSHAANHALRAHGTCLLLCAGLCVCFGLSALLCGEGLVMVMLVCPSRAASVV